MENQGTEDIDLVGLRNVNAELYQRFRVRCAEKKINYGTGFEQARRKPKMLTTTIIRAAFAEKMRQVAKEGYFIEYKRINDYWKKRLEGVVFPTEIVFLVGSSPYRFAGIFIQLKTGKSRPLLTL